jgi:hypothetical protein
VQGVQDSLTKVGAVNFTFRAASNVSPNASNDLDMHAVEFQAIQINRGKFRSKPIGLPGAGAGAGAVAVVPVLSSFQAAEAGKQRTGGQAR